MKISKNKRNFTAVAGGNTALASVMLLIPSVVMAICTHNSASNASVTGGVSCSISESTFSNPASTLTASGAGSILNVSGLIQLNTTNNSMNTPAVAHGIYAVSGGQLNVTPGGSPLQINTLGWGSRGIYATGTGSSATVNGAVKIDTGGVSGYNEYSNGIDTESGGRVTIYGSADIATGTAAGTGTANYGLCAINNSQVTVDGDVKVRAAGTEGSIGIVAYYWLDNPCW